MFLLANSILAAFCHSQHMCAPPVETVMGRKKKKKKKLLLLFDELVSETDISTHALIHERTHTHTLYPDPSR